MVVDEGSVLFGMTGPEVEKPVAGFSLPMEFRTGRQPAPCSSHSSERRQ